MDNKTGVLLDAAKKAIVAIGDVGVLLRHQMEDYTDGEKARYLVLRQTDGVGINGRLEQAFYALQEAIKLYEENSN